MDTTREYIKLCKKAMPLQIMPIPPYSFVMVKPFWATSPKKHLVRGVTLIEEEIKEKNRNYDVYLQHNPHGGLSRKDLIYTPRLDQIWEMLPIKGYDFVTYTSGLAPGIRYGVKIVKPIELIFSNMGSLEQLWLHILMKIKYNRVWDNENQLWKYTSVHY